MTIENTNAYKKWLSKVQQDGIALYYVPEVLKTESLCLAAVKQDGFALLHVPEALKTERVCLAAVQQDGFALEHVPDALKTEAMCLVAVQQQGLALKFVPEALKTEALCLAAVQKHGYALEYVSNALKTEALCLLAVQQNSFALDYVPDALKTEAICFAAVQQDGQALEYVIRPTDQLVSDAEQLASWNRILMEVDETDQESKKHLRSQLINPLLKQVNEAAKLPAPVVDEIAILIEHCERLRVNIELIKELYCEKQQLAKPPSKHKKSVSPEQAL